MLHIKSLKKEGIMNNDNNYKYTYADFRMRYQITIEDIKHIKNRQWTVTYYLLLLFAAIIGFYKTVNDPNSVAIAFLWIQRAVLSLIAIAVAVLGHKFFLSNFQETLVRYRSNLVNHIIPELSPEFIKVNEELMIKRYCGREDWRDEYINQSKRDRFTLIFSLMLWIGAAFVIYYVFFIPLVN
jgi:hypothetical protein